MDIKQEVEALRKVPMFAKLEVSKLKLLAFTSEAVEFDDGDVIFHEGDGADAAYVILTGEVAIMTSSETGEAIAALLRPNQLFGELAVLTKEGRSSTLRAHGELRALRIDEDKFLKLLADNPTVAIDVMRQLSMKVASTHRLYEDACRRLEALESRFPH